MSYLHSICGLDLGRSNVDWNTGISFKCGLMERRFANE